MNKKVLWKLSLVLILGILLGQNWTTVVTAQEPTATPTGVSEEFSYNACALLAGQIAAARGTQFNYSLANIAEYQEKLVALFPNLSGSDIKRLRQRMELRGVYLSPHQPQFFGGENVLAMVIPSAQGWQERTELHVTLITPTTEGWVVEVWQGGVAQDEVVQATNLQDECPLNTRLSIALGVAYRFDTHGNLVNYQDLNPDGIVFMSLQKPDEFVWSSGNTSGPLDAQFKYFTAFYYTDQSFPAGAGPFDNFLDLTGRNAITDHAQGVDGAVPSFMNFGMIYIWGDGRFEVYPKMEDWGYLSDWQAYFLPVDSAQ